MPPRRRLAISLKTQPALEITRVSIRNEKVVYVLLVNKILKYPHGKSRVAYIGTTQTGVGRVAESAAHQGQELLKQRGIRRCWARIVTCKALRGPTKEWLKLERAMLLTFRELYGDVPQRNTQGKGIRERDEFDYFARSKIRKVIQELG